MNIAENVLKSALRVSLPCICVITKDVLRAKKLIENIVNELSYELVKIEHNNVLKLESFKNTIATHLKPVVYFDNFFISKLKIYPEITDNLENAIEHFKGTTSTFIFIQTNHNVIKSEFIYTIELSLPNDNEIIEAYNQHMSFLNKKKFNIIFTDDEEKSILEFGKIVTSTKFENILSLLVERKYNNGDIMDLIYREKMNYLKEYGLQELKRIPINEVVGFENVKEFVEIRKAAWKNNLPLKGLLIVGAQGNGKTEIAKGIAHEFESPLIQLDMSVFYSKYIGETEEKLRVATKTLEKIGHIVVLIDEADKYFKSTKDSHEVTNRLNGYFLNWMQERQGKIFIIATASNISDLSADFYRIGRFDKQFFVDFLNNSQIKELINQSIQKFNITLESTEIEKLFEHCNNFSGSEIKQIFIDAQYYSIYKQIPINLEILLECSKKIIPLFHVDKSNTLRIQSLKEKGFYPASSE